MAVFGDSAAPIECKARRNKSSCSSQLNHCTLEGKRRRIRILSTHTASPPRKGVGTSAISMPTFPNSCGFDRCARCQDGHRVGFDQLAPSQIYYPALDTEVHLHCAAMHAGCRIVTAVYTGGGY